MSIITGHFVTVETQFSFTWTNGQVTITAYWQGFDQRAMQAINGDDGGTWAPSTPITITGAGFGLLVSGYTQVSGPSGRLTTQGTSRFLCGVNDFPMLAPGHVGQSRKLTTSMLNGRSVPRSQAVPSLGSNGCLDGGLQTVTFATQVTGQNTNGTRIVCPIEVHNGSTIDSVTFSFKVNGSRSSVPNMPKARVRRSDISGTVVTLTSLAAGAENDIDGYVVVPTPASVALYVNGNEFQTFVVDCDQNNIVDTSQYTYDVEIIEEGNPSVTPIVAPVDVAAYGQMIALDEAGAGPPIDGVAFFQGMRVLAMSQTYPASNGIYVLMVVDSSYIWVRDPALSNASQLVNGLQVPVKQGTALAGSTWVLSFNSSSPTLGGIISPWFEGEVYGPGEIVHPQVPNGYLYKTTAGGTAGSTEPLWPTKPGKSVVDGGITWVCEADTATPLYFGVVGDNGAETAPLWAKSTTYVYGSVVRPSVPNGCIFVSFSGFTSSSSTEPTWDLLIGSFTSDNSGFWMAFPDTYNNQGTVEPQGNVWGDVVVSMSGITSTAFQ